MSANHNNQQNKSKMLTKKEKEKQKKEVNKLKIMEEHLLLDFEFRFNTVTGMPEYTEIEEEGEEWKRMNDYALNTIVRKMKHEGITWASRTKIAELIESDFADNVNPITDYFKQLERKEKKDRIKELAETIEVEGDKDLYEICLKNWLVASVANVFIKNKCANHSMFILQGAQGDYKSTWLENLCPPALRDYYIESHLDPDNKDHLFATTSNFIYNLDDALSAATKKKINAFKEFITKNKVKARKPYARYDEDLAKICNFLGSTNEDQFLHDSSGSRRFLPFKVKKIKWNEAQKLDMDKVWAQAYDLFNKGYQYWMDKDLQKRLERHNEKFSLQSFEFELVATWFEVPGSRQEAERFLTNTEIQTWLEMKTKKHLSSKRLGDAMKMLKFERWQKRVGKGSRKWVYSVNIVDEQSVREKNASAKE